MNPSQHKAVDSLIKSARVDIEKYVRERFDQLDQEVSKLLRSKADVPEKSQTDEPDAASKEAELSKLTVTQLKDKATKMKLTVKKESGKGVPTKSDYIRAIISHTSAPKKSKTTGDVKQPHKQVKSATSSSVKIEKERDEPSSESSDDEEDDQSIEWNDKANIFTKNGFAYTLDGYIFATVKKKADGKMGVYPLKSDQKVPVGAKIYDTKQGKTAAQLLGLARDAYKKDPTIKVFPAGRAVEKKEDTASLDKGKGKVEEPSSESESGSSSESESEKTASPQDPDEQSHDSDSDGEETKTNPAKSLADKMMATIESTVPEITKQDFETFNREVKQKTIDKKNKSTYGKSSLPAEKVATIVTKYSEYEKMYS
jgi:hypothetical protein